MEHVKGKKEGREGSIGRGDAPKEVVKSSLIGGKIYHVVSFKDPSLSDRIYESKKLRKIATEMLFDYYEAQIDWSKC